MSPRVEIEYLVRYVPKNPHKVWFLHKKGRFGRVDVVRDAVCDEICQYRLDRDPQEEPAISSLINDENPTVLTLDKSQTFQEETEHTKQGEAPDTDLYIGRERSQRERQASNSNRGPFVKTAKEQRDEDCKVHIEELHRIHCLEQQKEWRATAVFQQPSKPTHN
ncbi:hypothetical protein N7447_008179 [Penicillium robsamsonii]|uniref:uncharacterized protein n=1 Tax=Penicillium robsamsonii TaxID=1792511 RepID=UPI0025469664|nr:uncharacterized protein N7447_008179 [Penicillium robsamsonii]KAJ5815946.1 hypothetical protein N7447_008179 [Penicillium robsamsonii]